MTLHPEMFNYIKPTDAQYETMQDVRDAALNFAEVIAEAMPEGPDRTYVMRKLRELVMWANAAIVQQPDGAPRT